MSASRKMTLEQYIYQETKKHPDFIPPHKLFYLNDEYSTMPEDDQGEITGDRFSDDIKKFMKLNFVAIDYAGWELINFSTMKWYFTQHEDSVDIRRMKRDDNGQWFITDDHDEFIIYSAQGPDGEDDSEMIESYYQSWLKKNELNDVTFMG